MPIPEDKIKDARESIDAIRNNLSREIKDKKCPLCDSSLYLKAGEYLFPQLAPNLDMMQSKGIVVILAKCKKCDLLLPYTLRVR